MTQKAIYETANQKMFTNYAAAKAYADSIGDRYILIRTMFCGEEYTRFAHKDEDIKDEPYTCAIAIHDPATGKEMIAFSLEEMAALGGEEMNITAYYVEGDELNELEED